MATTPSIRLPEIQIINGKTVTSSLVIADYFGKRHDNVIRSIQTLECSPEFNALNFEAVEYTDPKGEKRPCYTITRDGFTFSCHLLANELLSSKKPTSMRLIRWKNSFISRNKFILHCLISVGVSV